MALRPPRQSKPAPRPKPPFKVPTTPAKARAAAMKRKGKQ